jgi:hypothetical protein
MHLIIGLGTPALRGCRRCPAPADVSHEPIGVLGRPSRKACGSGHLLSRLTFPRENHHRVEHARTAPGNDPRLAAAEAAWSPAHRDESR